MDPDNEDVKMGGIFQIIYGVAEDMGEQFGKVWDFLSEDLKVSIPWLRIPILLPDGVHINTGITPISLLGGAILTLLLFWLIKLIPFV